MHIYNLRLQTGIATYTDSCKAEDKKAAAEIFIKRLNFLVPKNWYTKEEILINIERKKEL